MSTRITIKFEDDDSGVGFHVYEDIFDTAPVVHLQLTGVSFAVDSSGFVQVTLPVDLALAMGIIDAERAAAIGQQHRDDADDLPEPD